MPVPTNEDAIQCAHESSWGSHALDIESWNDYKAPVVKLRQLEDVLFDDLEFCGIFTDKLIGIGSSFLAKSPENGLYVLNKCVMRNMVPHLPHHHINENSLVKVVLKFKRNNFFTVALKYHIITLPSLFAIHRSCVQFHFKFLSSGRNTLFNVFKCRA